MDDKEIVQFIRKLESQVPKNGAEAKFVAFGEVALYANRQGYLRMAIELLKCAFEETYPEADLNYLFDSNSEFGIEHLTTDEYQIDILTGKL